jgi:hypothetical protein
MRRAGAEVVSVEQAIAPASASAMLAADTARRFVFILMNEVLVGKG